MSSPNRFSLLSVTSRLNQAENRQTRPERDHSFMYALVAAFIGIDGAFAMLLRFF
jgi:hypothetical protein